VKTWFTYLKYGLSRKLPQDRIAARKGDAGIKANLRNLSPYFRRYWPKGLLGFVFVILASVLAFPPPLITRYLIDKVILGRQTQLIAGTILLLVCVLAAEKLLRVLEEFYFARLEKRVTLDLHQDLIARVLRFPKSFFDVNQTGYIMSRLSQDVEGLRWFFSSSVIHIIGNIIRFLGGLGLLFYLEWRLSLAVLVLLPGLGWLIRYFSNKSYILSRRSLEQKAEASGCFQESLSEADLIKAYVAEDRAQKSLMASIKSVFQISLEQTTVNSLANLAINSMPGLARAVVLAAGAFWVIEGRWSIGSLLAYQAYLAYVFGPAQFLASANLRLQEALAALERVSALFDIIPEENMETGRKVKRLKGAIEFRGVSFAYNGSEPVLQNISFFINSGEKVAIIGPSGVGKTTLLSLLLCFYRPTGGEIYFDDRPASEYELNSLRRRIGYVAQQPRLMSGTIIENLRFGNVQAEGKRIIQAAKAANIHDFISALPDGYETRIGEKGIGLSAGQKQRMAIARALIKDPDILILDEPTAALDSQAEKSLFDSLPDVIRKKTLFVATHRLSTLRHSDRILLLNENRLVEMGTHPTLMEANDYYRTMLAYQQPIFDNMERWSYETSSERTKRSTDYTDFTD
jgi:ABC-type multidrug transport system fused ATPase/permease subunit